MKNSRIGIGTRKRQSGSRALSPASPPPRTPIPLQQPPVLKEKKEAGIRVSPASGPLIDYGYLLFFLEVSPFGQELSKPLLPLRKGRAGNETGKPDPILLGHIV